MIFKRSSLAASNAFLAIRFGASVLSFSSEVFRHFRAAHASSCVIINSPRCAAGRALPERFRGGVSGNAVNALTGGVVGTLLRSSLRRLNVRRSY